MSRFALALIVAALLPLGAHAKPESAALTPYEDLLEVLAVHAWHLDDDLYRRPAPRDSSGRNVFRATVDRLDGWHRRFPTRLPDVVAYARAQAFERLGAWEQARRGYEDVSAMPHSALALRVRTDLSRTEGFVAADALPETGETLQDVIDALAAKLEAWRSVADGGLDPVHRQLCLVEIERLEVRSAILLVQHQHALENGPATAERALRALIERHPDSRLLPRHVLRLADYYAAQADTYADAIDRPLDFDPRTYQGLVDRALDAYQKLASWDGIPEKPIATARFDAVTAMRDEIIEARR
jgi:hypothetical protein